MSEQLDAKFAEYDEVLSNICGGLLSIVETLEQLALTIRTATATQKLLLRQLEEGQVAATDGA